MALCHTSYDNMDLQQLKLITCYFLVLVGYTVPDVTTFHLDRLRLLSGYHIWEQNYIFYVFTEHIPSANNLFMQQGAINYQNGDYTNSINLISLSQILTRSPLELFRKFINISYVSVAWQMILS